MGGSSNRSEATSSDKASASPRLLTPKDVAAYLNITESQVYTLMREGDLLALKIGRRGVWRVDREELERYLERLKEEAHQRVSKASRRPARAKKTRKAS